MSGSQRSYGNAAKCRLPSNHQPLIIALTLTLSLTNHQPLIVALTLTLTLTLSVSLTNLWS